MENTMAAVLPEGGLGPADQEMFDRVWRRVMHQGRPEPPAPESDQEREERQQAALQEDDTPALDRARPAPGPEHGDRPPQTAHKPRPSRPEDQVPQLGTGSKRYAPVLKEMMEGEGGLRLDCQTLARRTQGSMSRSLSAMAASHQRAQRRLGAVYYLLVGRRCPASMPRSSLPAGTEAALRELFMREQRWMLAYRRGAGETKDDCLSGLFRELEGECADRMDEVRRLLERG